MIFSNDIEVERKYRSDPAVNQSSLKDIIKGVQDLKDKAKKREESPTAKHYVVGQAIDTILTGADGDFENEFYVSQLEKLPSEKELEIAEMTFQLVLANLEQNVRRGLIGTETFEVKDLEAYPNELAYAIKKSEWQPRWKTETKLDKIIESCSDYFKELVGAIGKTMMSKSDFNQIMGVVTSLRTNPRTAKYFDRPGLKNNKNVDIHYQVPVFATIDEVKCKALFDMIIVFKNDEGKVTRVIPCDLKSMAGYTIHFLDSAKKYRYDIQSSFYTDCMLAEDALFPEGFPKFEDDTMFENFTFIVESKTSPGTPLVFIASDEFLDIGRNGRKNNFTGISYTLGYRELLQEYAYQMETGFVEDKIIADNNGVLGLMWDTVIGGNDIRQD